LFTNEFRNINLSFSLFLSRLSAFPSLLSDTLFKLDRSSRRTSEYPERWKYLSTSSRSCWGYRAEMLLRSPAPDSFRL